MSDINIGCTATDEKMARCLKISDSGSRGIVLCSENKGANQLRCYCTADMRLFLHMQKAGFLMMRLVSLVMSKFFCLFIIVKRKYTKRDLYC